MFETYRMLGRYHESSLVTLSASEPRKEARPVVRSGRRSNGPLLRLMARLVSFGGLTVAKERAGLSVAIEREEP
jgi:hypothetical protein